DVDVGDLHRVDLRPEPGLRGAEVGDARRHRDAGAGQRDDRLRAGDELGEALGAPGCYLPLHRALRLPRKAAIPSLASSLPKAAAKPPFSASMPSSMSAWSDTSLICSRATGAWAASFRPHISAVSNSSWSGTTRLASPNSSASSARIASPTRFI